MPRPVGLPLAATVAAALAGCAGGGARPALAPAPAADDPGSGLPPVPRVVGALDLRVGWPGANQSVGPRDSTFVFGTVGSGDATLTVNGAPVAVAPNGAFLGFLPVPPAGAPRYSFVLARGADTVRRVVPVRVPARRTFPEAGALVVDTASLSPTGRATLRATDPVRVSVRAPRNAQAWLAVPAGAGATDTAEVRLALHDVGAAAAPDGGTTWAVEVPAARLTGTATRAARLLVARGGDTVRLAVPRIALADGGAGLHGAGARRYVRLGAAGAVADTDRVVVGRPVPAGTYKWFFLPGTVVERTGAQAGHTRVRLDQQLEVWVDDADATALPDGWAPARRVVGGARVAPAAGWVDVVLPMAERPAHEVIERGRDVELVLYGTQLSPEILPVLGTAADSLVRQVVWTQEATDRVRVTLRLSRDPYGYLVLWERGALVLRLRRPPAVDAARPLAGRTIAVDAGHPPGGATGPTGLWEPVAVLPVAERVRALLEARGATVVMTRTTAEPVGLAERPTQARRANADAFVSVHLNALPDGVNPFTANGTSTLFFHQHSEPLARHVQREMVRRFGIRDLGIHYQNLAVARPPWMPAILTEGLFLMLPEQEAAMRSAEGRERYARAIVDGLEAYFRELAGAR